MKIGLIGHGVVGKAASRTLSNEYELVIYDKFLDLDSFDDLINCKFIFVMVPTPFSEKLNCMDDSAILESLNSLEEINYGGTVIIKSTLPPGFCDQYVSKYPFNIVFNPEFLRESTTPYEDFANQDIVVIGTPHKKIFEDIKFLYRKVLHPDAKYYHTSLVEAEMIKVSQNTMLASRVAIANMIYDACEEHQIKYDLIKEIAFDNFEILGPHMVQVPGPDGKRGFGGKCLPKDIMAFSSIHESELLSMIIKYNNLIR